MTFQNPTDDIISRLQVTAAILIPFLFWLTVVAIMIGQAVIKLAAYVWPLLVEHVTLQMGRKVYDDVNLDKYFLELV